MKCQFCGDILDDVSSSADKFMSNYPSIPQGSRRYAEALWTHFSRGNCMPIRTYSNTESCGSCPICGYDDGTYSGLVAHVVTLPADPDKHLVVHAMEALQ